MKKIVVNVEFNGDRMKTKAMKAVSKIPGVESVSMDMKDKKLTVTGDIDPVCVVEKLRKLCPTDVLSVGPAKEPEKKKEEPKKDNKPKEQEKKDEPNWADLVRASEFYRQQMTHQYYCRSVVEEDPNSCVIC